MSKSKSLKFKVKSFSEAFKSKLRFGESIRGVSKEIGVSHNTLYRAFNGNMIELESALRMAHYANIDINDYTTLTP